MSREGRAAHSFNKNRHAQRQFGEVKATLQPVGTDTKWVPAWLEGLEGIGSFNADAIITLPLGATSAERTVRLRQASRMGVLRMSARRTADGQFIEYRWELS